MATIDELAQMSLDVYDGTASASQNTGPGSPLLAGLSSNWTVVMTSATTDSDWADGYFAVAYRNKSTGEIVIANRGTKPSSSDLSTTFSNLWTDLKLAAHQSTAVQTDAVNFAKQVVQYLNTQELNIPNLIETGHSLGGNEAQAALVYLVLAPTEN